MGRLEYILCIGLRFALKQAKESFGFKALVAISPDDVSKVCKKGK
jgi:hypothetical protein